MLKQRGAKNKSAGGGIGGSGGHRLRIVHLDKTTIEYKFDKSTLGKDCMLFAAEELKIKEHSYFSLKFKSLRGKTRWVHANKPIKRQLEKYSLDGLSEPTLFLEVKFYPTHVHMVGDEVTRYLFYLQLKMDILDGRLECSAEAAIKLAAYSVQSEFGDFDPYRHSTLKLREMNLLPEKHCNIGLLDSMLAQISELHQKFHGVSISAAEQNYLNITQSLSEYGQEGFEVLDDSYNKLSIGACATGIFVKNFIGEPPLYMKWEELKNMTYTDKYFGVESTKHETILFNTTNVDSAKYIWWCLSEQNMFFLKQSQQLASGHHHYCSRPNSRRSGMTSYASEEILSSDGANGRSTDSPSLNYPLQHAVSTSCFLTGPRTRTGSARGGLSRYHSDIDVNSQAVGGKHFSPRTTFTSPSRHSDLTPSHLCDTTNHASTLPVGCNGIPGYIEKPPKHSTVPKLVGFRKISYGEMFPENNSLPSSQRSSGSFSSHASVPISPLADTCDSGSTGQRHSPSSFNVIYEGEVASHRGLLSKRDSSVKNKYMEPSGSSQIHSQLSKTNSVPGVDLSENPALVVSKLYSTVIPRKYSKSEDDPMSPTEGTHNNTESTMKAKSEDRFVNSERFVPLPEHKVSLPRRSASLAHRSITDDPVKYYKFLASLFKRKYESWCTDEFSNIKTEMLSTSHSKKPENINKNRYRDVLPFNSTRVRLDANSNNESSDYINASQIMYIIKDHNYHFIAAQSPMGHTCTNFWQMVWEQDVKIIAMLEGPNKEDTHPSHVYFPASCDPTIDDYIQFDQYKISIRSYQDKGAFLFRQFKVKHIPTGEYKKVCHLQFLDWVEQDSPKSYEGFQAYIDYIRGVFSKETTPLLIHCNSGTGPTGVFILLYLLQEHIKLQEILHVQNALSIIRRQRMSMVATPAQFKFVYFSMYKYTQYLLAMEDRHTLI